MEHLPHNATMICAHLIRQGYIKKNHAPTLEVDEKLFSEVQTNLEQVGMELVYNSYSPYYAIRLKPSIQESVEVSNNLGLKNNEVAMLVILWSKLILPQRMAENANIVRPAPGASNTPSIDNIEKTGASLKEQQPKRQGDVDKPDSEKAKTEQEEDTREKIYIRWNELYAEFGEHFGTKTAFKSVLTRLSNLQFIRIHNEVITEGILLDLLVDGYQMANEIKKSALAFKLAGISDEENWDEWDEEEDEDTNTNTNEEEDEDTNTKEDEDEEKSENEENNGGSDRDV